MIPKIIHYCWFGGQDLSPIVKKCIRSWNLYCPDYEIKLWNEINYDVNKIEYVREAYESKKWAFVSDYVRLDIIYRYGGIYLDTDVELVKNLDELLPYKCFFSADNSGINTGLGFGAEKECNIVKEMLDLYNGKHFIISGKLDLTPCTEINSKIFLGDGYQVGNQKVQIIKEAVILPPEYFSPLDGESKLRKTENTFGVHWGSRTWETGITKVKASIRMRLGYKAVGNIKSFFRTISLRRDNKN